MVERTPIQLSPGVVRRGSEAEMAGRWRDTQLVRWIEGVMRPVMGWEKLVLDAGISGTIRAMHSWTDNDGILRTAILTGDRLYILETNHIVDISPVPAIVGPAADLTLGGYGDWEYGDYPDSRTALDNPYGTPRPEKIDRKIVGPIWTLDNWGEDLLAMVSSDGRLLRWRPSDPPGSLAAAVPNAPISNRTFVVTPERHVMLFQMGGEQNVFGWCDQEDVENWAFTDITSMAGRYDIQPAGMLIAAKATRFGVIMFLPSGMYHSRYLGLPYIYSLDYIGKFAAPLTNACIIQTSDLVLWPSLDAFWSFNGSTVQPIDCDVLDWWQSAINDRFATVTPWGMFLGMQTECWWFFPAGDDQECSLYVIFNYQERWWAIGKLRRSAGVTGTALQYPLMTDGQSVFRHEYGLYYYDAPELPYAQTAAINVANGARQVTISKIIVDTRAPAGDVQFFVGIRKNRIMTDDVPPRSTLRLKGPFRVRADGKLSARRMKARDIVLRIQSKRSGVEPWTFGQLLAKLTPGGER